MTINLVQGFRTKHHPKHKTAIGLYPDAKYLVIRIPDSKSLNLLFRAFILALFIVYLPWFNTLLPTSTTTLPPPQVSSNDVAAPANRYLLPLLFRDLANEGFFRKGHKAIFVSNDDEKAIHRPQILNDNQIDLISATDSSQQSLIHDNTIDFAYVSAAFPAAANFIERTLKIGGLVALQLSYDPSARFHKPENYKMVYLRRFDDASTVMAMRKTSHAVDQRMASPTGRRLLAEDAKMAALKNLEDVLLEPPRASSGKSSRYLKRTRYLPDLMGDTLEGYSRRVFIDVGLPEKEGESGSPADWFAKNYPTRNKNFEMYKIETVTEDSSGKEVSQTGMSEWLEKNVKEDEYVVMKAEAEVVEEMMKSKVLKLVDELFMECKPQRQNNNMMSRRAYWQCLALYGQLRDEGVAVHQWWG